MAIPFYSVDDTSDTSAPDDPNAPITAAPADQGTDQGVPLQMFTPDMLRGGNGGFPIGVPAPPTVEKPAKPADPYPYLHPGITETIMRYASLIPTIGKGFSVVADAMQNDRHLAAQQDQQERADTIENLRTTREANQPLSAFDRANAIRLHLPGFERAGYGERTDEPKEGENVSESAFDKSLSTATGPATNTFTMPAPEQAPAAPGTASLDLGAGGGLDVPKPSPVTTTTPGAVPSPTAIPGGQAASLPSEALPVAGWAPPAPTAAPESFGPISAAQPAFHPGPQSGQPTPGVPQPGEPQQGQPQQGTGMYLSQQQKALQAQANLTTAFNKKITDATANNTPYSSQDVRALAGIYNQNKDETDQAVNEALRREKVALATDYSSKLKPGGIYNPKMADGSENPNYIKRDPNQVIIDTKLATGVDLTAEEAGSQTLKISAGPAQEYVWTKDAKGNDVIVGMALRDQNGQAYTSGPGGIPLPLIAGQRVMPSMKITTQDDKGRNVERILPVDTSVALGPMLSPTQPQPTQNFFGTSGPGGTVVPNRHAYDIAHYNEPEPAYPVGARNPNATRDWEALHAAVVQENPNFSAGTYQVAQKARLDTTSGKTGTTITAFNTAIDHLDQFQKAMKALDNGTFLPGTSIWNYVESMVGHPELTNAAAVQHFLAGEAARVATSAAPDDTEIREATKNLSLSASPAQTAGQIDQTLHVLSSKIGEISNSYHRATKDGLTDNPFVSPSARQVLVNHGIDADHPTVVQPAGGGAVAPRSFISGGVTYTSINGGKFLDPNGNPYKK